VPFGLLPRNGVKSAAATPEGAGGMKASESP
jgi:hypothetical protein